MMQTRKIGLSKRDAAQVTRDHVETALEAGRYAVFAFRVEAATLLWDYDVFDFPDGDFTAVMQNVGKSISEIMRAKKKELPDESVEQDGTVLSAEGTDQEGGNGQSQQAE
jgi:hypothetical protein